MAAKLLRPPQEEKRGFTYWVNYFFDRLRQLYDKALSRTLNVRPAVYAMGGAEPYGLADVSVLAEGACAG